MWKATVNYNRHNNELGDYRTDVYVQDYAGNLTYVAGGDVIVGHRSGSASIPSSTVSFDQQSYDVYAYGLTSAANVQFPTWTDANGQDDLQWINGTNLGNGTWKATIYFNQHNNEQGIYHTHIYQFDSGGNASFVTGFDIQVKYDTVLKKQPVNFYSMSWDADSEDNTTLGYHWKVIAPSGAVSTFNAATISPSLTETGVYTIQHWVNDQLGAQSNVFTRYVEALNLPPIAGFIVSPTTTYRGDTINVTSTARDPDGYVNLYQYYVTPPGSGEYLYTTNQDWFTSTVFNRVGPWIIRQHVVDNENKADTLDAVQTVTIADHPPVVAETNPSGTLSAPTIVNSKTPQIKWTYADQENDLQVAYRVQIFTTSSTLVADSGVVNAAAAAWTSNVNLSDLTTYLVQVQAFDGYLWSNVDSKYMEVVLNRPPVAAFTWSPNPVWEGDTVQLINQSTDPDNNLTSGTWTITDPSGHVTTASGAGAYNTSITNAVPGTYTVQLTATDTYNAMNTAVQSMLVTPLTIQAIVQHTAEWLDIHEKLHHNTTIIPMDFYSGEILAVTAVSSPTPVLKVQAWMDAADADGQPIHLQTDLQSDGSGIKFNGELFDLVLSNPDTGLPKGVYDIHTQITYGNGIVKQADIPIKIIGNAVETVNVHRIQ